MTTTARIARKMHAKYGSWSKVRIRRRLNRLSWLDAEGCRCVKAENAGRYYVWSRVYAHLEQMRPLP